MSSTVHLQPRQRWTGLAVLVLAVTLVAVDATVLSLAIPSISETLRPSGTQLLWIGDAYSFVLAGLLVSMGSLSDRIGRKRLLLIGATAFGAASLLAAYSPTMRLADPGPRAARRGRGDDHAVHAVADPHPLPGRPRAGHRDRHLGCRRDHAAPRSARWSAGCCWSTSGGARSSC